MRRILCLLLALVMLSATALMEAPAVLKPGDRGGAVKALQQRLIELGLLQDKADGLYGPKTQQAVLALQQQLLRQGEAVETTGTADPDTLRLMADDYVMRALLDLKPGDKGKRVSALQTQLYDLRFLSSLPDGDYGQQTEAAVRALQEQLKRQSFAGVEASGVADHITRMALAGDPSLLGLRLPQVFDEAKPATLTGEDLYARAAILVDLGSGRTLLDKASQERFYPASTTKIMTLLLALESLPPDRVLTIPAEAGEVPKDSSLVPVHPGEQMTADDLFHGLMLRSGNDAANALAVLCAGSVEAFVSQMNARARALKLQQTHFTNPHGYHDAEHYSSARDLALLTKAALQQEAFQRIIRHTSHALAPTKLRPQLYIEVNTDLFKPASPFFYGGAYGVKSGYTRSAGFCYVGCAEKDGRTLLAVILNCRTRNQGWTDMKRLFDLGFAQ